MTSSFLFRGSYQRSIQIKGSYIFSSPFLCSSLPPLFTTLLISFMILESPLVGSFRCLCSPRSMCPDLMASLSSLTFLTPSLSSYISSRTSSPSMNNLLKASRGVSAAIMDNAFNLSSKKNSSNTFSTSQVFSFYSLLYLLRE